MFGSVIFADHRMAQLDIVIQILWTDKEKKESEWIEQPKIVNP